MVAPVRGEGFCAGGYGGVFSRRVTVLGGHFGSGKTELTLSAALALAPHSAALSLVDLDVVKPYLRSRSARAILKEAGVELVAPLGEYAAADLPIVLPEIRTRLCDPNRKILLDVGGDDLGVRALASLCDAVPQSETDFFLILNFNRPLTPDPDSAVEMVRRITAVSRLQPTGLLANTHLMGETTEEVVLDGLRLAQEAGRGLGLPVRGVGVPEVLARDLSGRTGGVPVLPVRRIVRPPFEMDRERRAVGPLFVVG